jgi:hypothetical protein
VELIVMILFAFPIGYFVANRTAGFIAFIALHGFVFTFQSTDLVLEWVDGSKTVFGPYPKASGQHILGYGIVNLAIFAASLGLLALGQRLAARRRTSAVDLQPAVRA